MAKKKVNNEVTQQYTFRIPVELKKDLEAIAAGQDRSLSRQIIYALRLHVEEIKEKLCKSPS